MKKRNETAAYILLFNCRYLPVTMELLFAGLIALGVSVAVVFLLKCLCFLGDCLSAQRKQMQRSRPLNYSQAMAVSSAQQSGVVPSGSARSADAERPLDSFRRMSERLYVICMESNTPKVVLNQKQIETDLPETDLLPTYEEATSLMNHHFILHSPPSESHENRS